VSTIQLKTPVPGPCSRAMLARREAAVPRGVSQVTPIFVARAEGAVIEDVDGNRFLDFAGGIGCLNAGQCAPAVVEAAREQIGRFLHTCFMVTPYEGYVRLAERLNALAPGNFPKKTVLLNSGAEAVENAVKIARAYTKRPAVICFEDGFHGRTLFMLALTSKTHPYKAGFEPFPAEVYRIPYAYCYRCSYGLQYPSCNIHCAQHLEDTFKRVVAAESVAAVIVEPVLGEGGFVTPPPEFLPAIQAICRKYGIVFIADEVQTGFARTGRLFASEHFGIEPDLITTAKSLGGGFPLAAVTGRAEIMDHTGPGALGGTFGGNPVACAAALAVLETIERENLCERATKLGERFRKRAANFPMAGEIRGLGAMQAIELTSAEATQRLSQYCYEHGLITISAGTYGNVVRLLMPLVITDGQFEEGLDVLEAGFREVAG
jgi:4-aminobutyrate aminotransferase / (S)-3-amino-2-methylpropionate transaminase / 5-aminovalerate transaminase